MRIPETHADLSSRDTRAFALVEVLVALAILFAVLFALFRLVSLDTNTARNNRVRLAAEQRAADLLERYGTLQSAELQRLFGPGHTSPPLPAQETGATGGSPATGVNASTTSEIESELRYQPDSSRRGSGYLEVEVSWPQPRSGRASVRLGRLVADARSIELPSHENLRSAAAALAAAASADLIGESASNPGSMGPGGIRSAKASPAETGPSEFDKLVSRMLARAGKSRDASSSSHDFLMELDASAPQLGLAALAHDSNPSGRAAAPQQRLEHQSIPDGTYRYSFQESKVPGASESVVYTLETSGTETLLLVHERIDGGSLLEARTATELGDYVQASDRAQRAAAHVDSTNRRAYLFRPSRDATGRLIPLANEVVLWTFPAPAPDDAPAEALRKKIVPMLKGNGLAATPQPTADPALRARLGW